MIGRPDRPRSAWMLWSAALAAVGALGGCGPSPPRAQSPPVPQFTFRLAGPESGIDFLHRTGQGAGANIVETTGSGCGLFDFDNDGLQDVFLVQARATPEGGHALYRNLGGGKFEDVTEAAGLSARHEGLGMGCAVGDFDGDGWRDLYVTCYGRSRLYRNAGGRFEDVTDTAGVAVQGFATAACFADLDRDGRPDLYVARYCLFDARSRQLCENHGIPTSCPPYYYPPESDRVFRNLGGGRFQDVTAAWGLTDTTGRGLGVIPLDYNRDGILDLFVANDGSPNFLYRFGKSGGAKSVAAEEGIGVNGTGSAVANMGCDFGDLFNDGTFAGMTGVFQNEVKPLWRYRKGIGFEDVARQAGIVQSTMSLLTFGLGMADMDSDGWLDIVLANGHVQDQIQRIDPQCTYAQPRFFLRNTGKGAFVNAGDTAGPGINEPAVGRGMALGDIDNDGDVDLLVNNSTGRAMLIFNEHPRRNWLSLTLVGRGPNWEALGTVVELKSAAGPQTRFVRTAGSFASANDPRVHFGLGETAAVEELRVPWLNGPPTVWRNPPVGRRLLVVQPGAAIPAPLAQSLAGLTQGP